MDYRPLGKTTMLLGYSSFEHLELAVDDVARGPLPQAAIEQVTALWTQMARGEWRMENPVGKP